MYFYSIEKLKQRLAAGPLQEREGLPYALAFAFSTSLVTSLPNESLNRWDYTETFFSLILSIIGTYWLYRQNGGDSGRDFIYRGIVLGWVVFVRLATVAIPAMFGMIVILDFLGALTDETRLYPDYPSPEM
ncbi:MAG: hypothetical protein Q8M03_14465 [Legionella sp.]|nr:hypothetical protein [Legionella sp.]